MKNNYYIQKDGITGDTIFIEFNKIEGYQVLPKTKKEDEIEVNKIVFVSNKLSEKIIKKKIDTKIKYLLKYLEEIDEDTDPDGVRRTLVDAERLKLMIINTYVKYLGHTYQSLTLEKIKIIIEQLRVKLYVLKEKDNIIEHQKEVNKEKERRKAIIEEEMKKFMNASYEEETKKGRGR